MDPKFQLPEQIDNQLAEVIPGMTEDDKMEGIALGGKLNQMQAFEQKNADAFALMDKAQSGANLSKGEMLGLIFSTMLPILAGAAMGGKRGALAGVKAAGEGGTMGLKVRETEALQDSRKNMAKAKMILDERQYQERRGDQLEDSLILSEAKNEGIIRRKLREEQLGIGPKGMTINMKNVPPTSVEHLVARDVAINKFDQAAGLLRELRDEYGTSMEKDTPEQFYDVLKRKIKEYGPNTPERKLLANMEGIVLEAAQKVKGAASDKDTLRMELEATGGALASLDLQLDLVQQARDNLLEAGRMETSQLLSSGNNPGTDPSKYNSIANFRGYNNKIRGKYTNDYTQYSEQEQNKSEFNSFLSMSE